MILIASPTGGLRSRWRRALQGGDDIHEVSRRPTLERRMAALKPTILLVELALLQLRGLEDLASIQRLSPRTRTIVLSGAPDEKEEVSALKAGARGYCDANIAPAMLKRAVTRVRRGEVWGGRKAISTLIDELAALTYGPESSKATRPQRGLAPLTSRERQVARLVGRGARNREVAHRLKVTEKTVKAYVTAIFRKLGLSNRSQLAFLAAKHNWTLR